MSKYLSHEEIHNQYISLQQTLDYMLENSAMLRNFFSGSGDLVMIGCGSSYWMSLSAHKTLKLKTGRRAYAVKAGDVVLCPEEYTSLYDNPVFLCPSRSGLTRELLDAVDIFKEAYPNCKVFSIVEYVDNKLTAKSDMSLNIFWANEKSVCQTRSFSNLYLAFIVLAAIIGEDNVFIENLKKYLKAAPQLCKQHEAVVRELADPAKITDLVALGGGLQYGVVIEGAYIVIEMAEFASNYYQLLEYRHGPIVTGGPGTAVFICTGMPEEHESKMAEETKATGAKVYAVASKPVDWADHVFLLDDEYNKEIVALHFVFVMQSFAYYFSIARGKNPDSPGNLIPFIVY